MDFDSPGDGAAGTALSSGDFNGDGLEDLAVGIPQNDRVHVYFGPLRTQGAPELVTAPVVGQFGQALTSCDVDEDGQDELIVGAPATQIDGVANSGAVYVLVLEAGSFKTKLSFDESQTLFAEKAEDNDRFGQALATGGGVGLDCALAIGVPGEAVEDDLGAVQDGAGAVHILNLSDGFSVTHLRRLDANTVGDAVANGRFGETLAAGRLGAVHIDSLAVAAPFRNEFVDGGDVTVFYGFNTFQTQQFVESSLHVASDIAFSFGVSLAVGDFNRDGSDDLAIGSPFGAISGADTRAVGVVHVLYSNGSNQLVDHEVWHQDVTGVADVAEPFDRFGASVAAGNFDGDRYEDLVIGTPDEDSLAGRVDILFGSAAGLSGSASVSLEEDDVGGTLTMDQFGSRLLAADWDGNGGDDLGIGLPEKDGFDGLVYLVPVEEHVRRAEVLMRAGSPITLTDGEVFVPTSISAPVYDAKGRVAVVVRRTSDGRSVFLMEDGDDRWLPLLDSDDLSLPAPIFFGAALDSEDEFAVRVRFDLAARGGIQDLVYQIIGPDGVLAQFGDQTDSGDFIGQPGDPELGNGDAFFIEFETPPDRVLAVRPNGAIEEVITASTWVSGTPFDRFMTLNVSRDGLNLGAIVDLPGLVTFDVAAINGQIVAQSGDDVTLATDSPVGALQTSINDVKWVEVADGNWIFSAFLDGAGLNEALFASDGSQMSRRSNIEGFSLHGLNPAIRANHLGQALVQWTSSATGILALNCGSGLAGFEEIVHEGFRLDLDGDGLGDAGLMKLTSIQEAPPSARVAYVAQVDQGMLSGRALLRFAAECPLFSDGFESGDTLNWSP